MKFVDVKNDVAFHKIFGDEKRKVTLISFLNAAMSLEGEARVEDVTIENPYLYAPAHAGKTVVIDVRAKDYAGRQFIVEMQVADKEGFVKRVQFYAARDYATQIEQGEGYTMLKPTHFIGILNFNFTDNPNYYSHHQTIDVETGQCLLKDIQYFFIELKKFKKQVHELKSMMDKWTYFIKNAERLEMIPENETDEGLVTAYKQADKHNWSKKELNAYIDAGAIEADHFNEREKVRKEERAKAEAEKEQLRLCLQAEVEKERLRLQAEVEKERLRLQAEAKKEQSILNLHKIGISVEQITIAMGKSTAEIQNI